MIDLHCHILPGVDDGPGDIDEAARMMEFAAAGGTRLIVATPHANLRYPFDPARCRTLIDALQTRCPEGPKLRLGCEVHLTPENIARVLENPKDYALNGRDCVLLELPDYISPAMLEPPLDLLRAAGLRVILAHPERVRYLQQNPSYVRRLVEAGCFLQVTARSLEGGFGQAAESAATYLLRQRLAHFVASDGHRASVRRPGLDAAYRRIAQNWGEGAARLLLVANPEAAIQGLPVQTMPAPPNWLSSLLIRSSHAFRKPTIAQMS